jgi:hypothetical protein
VIPLEKNTTTDNAGMSWLADRFFRFTVVHSDNGSVPASPDKRYLAIMPDANASDEGQFKISKGDKFFLRMFRDLYCAQQNGFL